VPPTIHALLAARLDQLDVAERSVLERGSVEGPVFHRGAVVTLAPEETGVDERLIALVRKDLVRPERAVVADDEAFRFRHLLIRDTAYEALSKAARAELHERFAAWLQSHAAELVELDEILGYHLGQAYSYRVELGPLDDAAHALAKRAALHLLAGAERSRARGDTQAARALLGHAVDLRRGSSSAATQVELAVVLVDLASSRTPPRCEQRPRPPPARPVTNEYWRVRTRRGGGSHPERPDRDDGRRAGDFNGRSPNWSGRRRRGCHMGAPARRKLQGLAWEQQRGRAAGRARSSAQSSQPAARQRCAGLMTLALWGPDTDRRGHPAL
jgi:hypothetical protein